MTHNHSNLLVVEPPFWASLSSTTSTPSFWSGMPEKQLSATPSNWSWCFGVWVIFARFLGEFKRFWVSGLELWSVVGLVHDFWKSLEVLDVTQPLPGSAKLLLPKAKLPKRSLRSAFVQTSKDGNGRTSSCESWIVIHAHLYLHPKKYRTEMIFFQTWYFFKHDIDFKTASYLEFKSFKQLPASTLVESPSNSNPPKANVRRRIDCSCGRPETQQPSI